MENEIQYGQMNFNLPHDVVPLPSQGLFYANKKKSVKVGYLTAQDENLLANTNKGIMNVINQLLKTKIYEHDFRIDDMLTGDVEAILIFLRNTAFGTKYKLNLVDPKTGNLFEANLDLSEINIKEQKIQPDLQGLFSTTLPMSGDNVKLRILTYGEEALIDDEMEKYPVGVVAPKITRKLEAQIVSINGNEDKGEIVKHVQQMPIMDSKHIRTFLKDVEPRLDLNKKTKTPSGEMIDVNVSFGVDFFRPFFGL